MKFPVMAPQVTEMEIHAHIKVQGLLVSHQKFKAFLSYSFHPAFLEKIPSLFNGKRFREEGRAVNRDPLFLHTKERGGNEAHFTQVS